MAPLWVAYDANLGTLLRTCDAVGACLAVPGHPTTVKLSPVATRSGVVVPASTG